MPLLLTSWYASCVRTERGKDRIMNYADAQREYNEAMADLNRATARVARASAALTRAATEAATRPSPRPRRGSTFFGSVNVSGAHFGDGMVVNNVTGGDATVQVSGQAFTGGVVIRGNETRVGGRMITDGVAKVCRHCGGDKGWRVSNGVTTHTGENGLGRVCGREQ